MKSSKQILEAIQKAINLAVDDFDDLDTTLEVLKKSRIKDDIHAKDILFMRENFVDLDLPSGTLWGKYNLGVNEEKVNSELDPKLWYGDYYAWAETMPKEQYDASTYKFCFENDKDDGPKFTKYVDNGILELEDDAAYLINKLLRIPSVELCYELFENTTCKFKRSYNGIPGLCGVVFTGKNGNSIFIPSAGNIYGRSLYGRIFNNGYIWTSKYTNYGRFGVILTFKQGLPGIPADEEPHIDMINRHVGIPIRPVFNA